MLSAKFNVFQGMVAQRRRMAFADLVMEAIQDLNYLLDFEQPSAFNASSISALFLSISLKPFSFPNSAVSYQSSRLAVSNYL